jgi:hypothetical protein
MRRGDATISRTRSLREAEWEAMAQREERPSTSWGKREQDATRGTEGRASWRM